MDSNTHGQRFRITTFGESHGPAVGVVIDGIQPGLELGAMDIQAELDRRRPGQSAVSTSRNEADRAEILSGVFEGRTTGAPICILVQNTDARSGDYAAIRDLFRPGHGDLTWLARYGIRDWRGGGRLSGRETIGRVAAGAVARKLLTDQGVTLVGHVVEAAGVCANTFDPAVALSTPMRCGDAEAAAAMERAILAAGGDGDSVGGIVQVEARGVPAGWGDPVFDKLDARIAAAMMSIGAVKGVEIGAGFAAARMRGSEHNDPITPDGFASNHAGGILGGITSGAPVVVRLAIKPTSSIGRPQRTVDVDGTPRELQVRGRHDPCICPRAVPVAEAMLALVLVDALLEARTTSGQSPTLDELRATVDAGDAELVARLARRVDLTRAIGRFKGAHGVTEVDREAEVHRLWRDQAREHGLDDELADRMAELLLDAAKRAQLRDE